MAGRAVDTNSSSSAESAPDLEIGQKTNSKGYDQLVETTGDSNAKNNI